MTTPLIMLAILAVPLLIVWSLRLRGLNVGTTAAGVVGLVITFLFTASGHFAQTAPIAAMLPPLVPARVPLVHLTGLLEIAVAVGIAVPATRRPAGIAAIAVLVVFFPVTSTPPSPTSAWAVMPGGRSTC